MRPPGTSIQLAVARARTLPEAFQAVAASSGGRIALTGEGRSLTYAELDLASDHIAAQVLAHGPRRGECAGILIDRSLYTPAGILGLMKAGCAYVPLDPVYPQASLRHIAADAGIRIVVGSSAQALTAGLGHLDVVPLDAGLISPASGGSAPRLTDSAGAAAPAYVIYTSGTTGPPKGCVVTHGNVLALMRNTLPLFDFSPEDRWPLLHSCSFDFSVWELWGALLTGATAVCVPHEVARAPEDLLGLVIRERITVLNQVPSVFRAFSRIHAAAGDPHLPLRYVVFGGEGVDLDVVADFAGRTAPASPVLVNMYGITETTVHASVKILGDDDYHGLVASPIGVPLPHVTISILDERGRPVPGCEPGEMWIGGDGVAAGYLNRPELTAARFITLASPDGPRRCYRSGDLAKRSASGALEYLGRNDRQFKVRGFRIEPGEIEAALRKHDLVRDVAVITAERASGAALVACVVSSRVVAEADLSAVLRTHARSLLPAHMAPARYRLVSELPLTASGKLDRDELRGLIPPAARRTR